MFKVQNKSQLTTCGLVGKLITPSLPCDHILTNRKPGNEW